MVESESETVSQGEVEVEVEVESAFESAQNEQPKDNEFPSPGRQQPSIYSLTLDEFQNTLTDGGKNFGSMNMDEFLNSIWTAEENQAQAHAHTTVITATVVTTTSTNKCIVKQPSMPREGALALPAPLCQKTVDEVWSEIHKNQLEQNNTNNVQIPNPTPRQLTLGDMTLEDFLVKAGVVRERGQPLLLPQQQPYGLYQNSDNPAVGPSYTIGLGDGGGGGRVLYPKLPQSGVGEAQSRSTQVDVRGVRGGRKQNIDAPVEKVVERRQRRMIKNRESAARARARKQAYTVELEAELNQLKEENTRLKQALAELEKKRKRQYFDEVKLKGPTKAQKAGEKLRTLRRNLSCP